MMTLYTTKKRVGIMHKVGVTCVPVPGTGTSVYRIMHGSIDIRTYANAQAAFAMAEKINNAFLEGQKRMTI